jgi:hypothetical protein
MKMRFLLTFGLRRGGAFTLIEMLISIVMLALLILLVTQVVNTAAKIARPANKHIDTDTESRTVFDRMAIDFAKMLRRTDVDYYLKTDNPANYPGHSYGHSQGRGQRGQSSNDQMAFFSQVPGYYPSGAQSPISLVAYRVNSVPTSPYYNELQRMGVGLLWNGVSNGNPNSPNYTSPIVFLAGTPSGSGSVIGGIWPDATGSTTSTSDLAYETIGPGVFRFEYYYMLKNGLLSQNPFINNTNSALPNYRAINGLADVEAIAVTIAVIDSNSLSVLSTQNILDLAAQMWDFNTVNLHKPPGKALTANDIETQWNGVITANISSGAMPPAAVSAIRVYTRYFDLNNL